VRAGLDRRAIVWVVALAAGLFAIPTGAPSSIGVGTAEARDYYTRKRVNGRWITGRFPRQSSAPNPSQAGLEQPPTRPQASGHVSAAPIMRTSTSSSATRSLSLPLEPEGELRSRPVLAAATAPEDSLAGLFEASPSGSTPLAAAPQDARLLNLQAALYVRARTLTSEPEHALGSLPSPRSLGSPRPVPASPEPKAVSLDFQSGIKTTVFTDGTLVEEPFDPAALKELAGAHPARAPGGR
jgi:hypothetical protein